MTDEIDGEAEIDALLRRTVPLAKKAATPDSDLIARARSTAWRRRWTNPGLVVGYLLVAGALLLAIVPGMLRKRPSCPD